MMMVLSSCLKNKEQKCGYSDIQITAPTQEQDSIQHYLDSLGITASKLASGVFYKIDAQGSGAGIADLCSRVTVNYNGKLINGHTFDSTATGIPVTFQLGGVIYGWQKGLPLISSGGKITLIIPPSLGYGNKDQKDNMGNVVIPANSVLIFDIELVGVS